MRRQWPCSKCGYACSSTWRSLHTSKPVICNTCRSKANKNKVAVSPPPDQAANDSHVSGNSVFDQISSSSASIIQENTTFTVSQIGMIFGNLPFEPNLAFPAMLQDHSQDQPMLKSKAAMEFQDHFYCRTSLKTSASVMEDGSIQIKQEYDCQQTLLEVGNVCIWDPNKVQRKKRSRLPQYTLSPLARFINQLQYHSPQYNPTVNFNFNFNDASASSQVAHDHDHDHGHPKYDDVLIYEKCKYVADNEIGLGAVMLSPPVSSLEEPESSDSTTYVSEEESSSTYDTSDDTSDSNCLIDVPIRSSASE
ncbi:uncharacterized protein LOC105172570 [Sesamum indicum]|uniref:Uncharacterized protein LOC105172570 n=1 Tax=Sesamum indicum TaxID=4182 RepID=A0A6I9U449_SESIN|nr:uncharacterized protein LOC105172570 [Sesamum indicum]